MRYSDRSGGLSDTERERRQALRLRAVDMFSGGIQPPRVAHLLGVGFDAGRRLADFDDQGRGVAVPLVVGEGVNKAVADILGRTRVREISIIALGIDAELAEFARDAKLSAGEAGIFAAFAG